jgi:adenine-specific DNA-methyltransferase
VALEADKLTKTQLVELVETQRQELDTLREQREEGIKITFAGKDVAKGIARRVQPRTSRHLAKYSAGTHEEQARNVVMEGENLQAMTTLYRDRGQVDLILTDPPYNTGKDFRYNDRWDDDPNDPDLGKFVADDDDGRHTKWMRFMWPRLKVMRDMLQPKGVLAICIDYRELFRLGQMLDELFREENRLAIINWQKASAPKNDQNHVASTTEYVLVYAKDADEARTGALPRDEDTFTRYKNHDNDPRGRWREHDLTARTPVAKDQYGIQSPFTGVIYYPPGTRSWSHPKRNIKKWLEEWGPAYVARDIGDGNAPALMVQGGKAIPPDDPTDEHPRPHPGQVPAAAKKAAHSVLKKVNWPFIWFGLDGSGGPRVKRYLEAIRKGFVPTTYWADGISDEEDPLELGSTSWEWEQSGLSQSGIKELNAVVGSGHGFETVKPLQLMEKIIQIWCPAGGLIMDPFAGSGTTGHAVLEMNHAIDEVERRFILIEQGRPEKGDPYARSLTANRLCRVITGDWADGQHDPLGGGFRFYQLQKKVDAKALLEMERDEMTDAVIASHYDSNKRGGPSLIFMINEGYDFLVARNASDEGFFLVWDGSPKPPVFDADVYDRIVNEAKKAKLKPTYHVYARFNLFQSDDVRFYQIPDQILLDFGLNLNDPFNDDDGDDE